MVPINWEALWTCPVYPVEKTIVPKDAEIDDASFYRNVRKRSRKADISNFYVISSKVTVQSMLARKINDVFWSTNPV